MSPFQRAFAHLEDAADHWIKMSQGEDFGRKVPPLDILNWCTACLAVMSAIRHLIAAGRPNPLAHRRREVLRTFLGNPTLTHVCSSVVRDSWEHLDERMDCIIPGLRGGSASHVYMAADPPEPGQIALKRFDPVGFAIPVPDQAIPLRPAAEEIAALRDRLDTAPKHLSDEIVLPWPHDATATS